MSRVVVAAVAAAMLVGVATAPSFAASEWVARHGLSSAEYQREFDKWVGSGYRLTDVDGYVSSSGAPQYAAIWLKADGPAWQARHGLTPKQYEATLVELGDAGYRPVLVDAYRVPGDGLRYAAIFRRSRRVAWRERHGLTGKQYHAQFNYWVGRGYRLRHVSGYTATSGAARYAAIWERRRGPAWQARHGLMSEEYQATVDRLRDNGYQPVQVDGYKVKGRARYAVIFHRASFVWEARHDLTSAQYQSEFDFLSGLGYRLVEVGAHRLDGDPRYAAIWRRPPGSKPTAVVALGDSYVSGEGAGDYEQGTDGPHNFCHRSSNAAIKQVQIPGIAVRENLACSGSSTANITPGGNGRFGEVSQGDRLSALAKDYTVKMVVLGIGGNSAGGDDISFGTLLGRCMAAFADQFKPVGVGPSCRDQFTGTIIQRIQAAAVNVGRAIEQVKAVMAAAGYKDGSYKLVLQSYPSPVTEKIAPVLPGGLSNLFWQVAFGCPLRVEDMQWARTFVVPQIGAYWRTVAANHGVSFVEMAYAAENREICSSAVTGQPEWIRGVSIDAARLLNGDWGLQPDGSFDIRLIQESFHPNAVGQRQVARCLTAIYASPAPKGDCRMAPSGNLEFFPLPP